MPTLSSVAELIMGQSPTSDTYNDKGDGLPFYQGKTDFGFKHPIPRLYCSSPKKIAEAGDILISVRAPVGPTNIAVEKSCIGRGIGAIRAQSIDSQFLYFNLRYIEPYIASLGTGSTFTAINKYQLANLEVNQNDFEILEQRRIAYVLSSFQTAIEQQRRLIALTRELKSALMNKLFTEGVPRRPNGSQRPVRSVETEIGLVPESWEIVELASLLEETEQVNLRTEGKRQIKYIDVSSISREYLRVETTTEYLLKDAPGRARKKVKTGDVIFATVRPTLLRVAYIGEELNDQVCSTAFCVLRAKKNVSDKYIHYVVQREQFIKQLAAIESGASYPAVTDRQVKNQKIPKPIFDEQSQIAEILESCDKKAFQHAMKKEKLEELFRTLLHQLMTGQTRVNEAADITGL